MDRLAPYVAGWVERARSRDRAEARRQAWLRARVQELVDLLVRDFGVSRVILFGSLARGEATERSDVDLLVEGLAAERLIEASAAADRFMRVVHVDIVPAQLARPAVRERAEREGVVLHGC